tara:strand:- start:618 stop:911 length:294 start_codon:yes stop_codon:yes gene_type:complete
MTQKEAAAKLGIVQSGLAKMEAGQVALSVLQMCRYAELLGLTPIELFSRAEQLREELQEAGYIVEWRRAERNEIGNQELGGLLAAARETKWQDRKRA